MKTAVVTFHAAYNYGAVLQAYSLQKALEEAGFEPQMVDYWPETREAASKSMMSPLKGLKGLVINLLTLINYSNIRERRRRFDDFRRWAWKKSELRYQSNEHLLELLPNAELFITGSDQVWNPSSGIDPAYFLEFAVQSGRATASYAASIGVPDVQGDDARAMAPLIAAIERISVREHRAAEIVRNLTGRDAQVVVDPVFLQTAEQWNTLVKDPGITGDYLLVYAVRRRRYMEDIIRQIKQRYGLKVVLIPGTNPAARGFISADRVVWDAGPADFVSLFAHAKAVCTNSFHGTAFSIIYNKPFVSVSHTKGDSRVTSILERLDQRWRQLKEGDDLPEQFLSDFDCTSILDYHTRESFSFLNSLKKR
ncbi:polysaccharide pyruvyl transferase family protein [Isoalcanivorax beigongshangi]|uniref:Polysaccharide pyruvyl transferase family protein n=1 Tax=Isoalcanivorax beigongshangi TaxID=3238810 RepID=A0ABV4AG64_9GAMM